jgi:hypothetical protein
MKRAKARAERKFKIEAFKKDILAFKKELKLAAPYKVWKDKPWVKDTDIEGKVQKILGPKNRIMACMFMLDGSIDMFVASAEKQYFDKREKSYMIDPGAIFNVPVMGMTMAFYHEGVSLPLGLKDGLDSLLEKINNKEVDTEVELTLESRVFERFIKSEFVQKLMTASKIFDDLTMVKFLLIIQMIYNILAFLVLIILLVKK